MSLKTEKCLDLTVYFCCVQFGAPWWTQGSNVVQVSLREIVATLEFESSLMKKLNLVI